MVSTKEAGQLLGSQILGDGTKCCELCAVGNTVVSMALQGQFFPPWKLVLVVCIAVPFSRTLCSCLYKVSWGLVATRGVR